MGAPASPASGVSRLSLFFAALTAAAVLGGPVIGLILKVNTIDDRQQANLLRIEKLETRQYQADGEAMARITADADQSRRISILEHAMCQHDRSFC